jgi:hypothetical protein
MTINTHSIRRLAAAGAVAAGVLVPAAPAFAFHHVFVPASECGQGDFSGGSNPTAVAALLASGNHPLPLPPAGTPSNAVNAPATGNCTFGG